MQFFLDFVKESLKLIGLQTNKKDVKKEDIKDAYLWFLNEVKNKKSTRVQPYKGWFEPGKFYTFGYDAKYKDILTFWDRSPIVFSLGTYKQKNGVVVNLGINISFYIPTIKTKIIKHINALYKDSILTTTKQHPYSANQQNYLKLNVELLRNNLNSLGYGFDFAIRRYLPNHIIGPVHCICYEDWEKLLKMELTTVYPKLAGDERLITNIYILHKNYIIKNKNKKM